MKNLRCVSLAAFVLLVASSVCSCDKDAALGKLQKSFEEINKYLEKKVESHDPLALAVKVESLLDKESAKCNLFGRNKHLIEALRLLVELSKTPSNTFKCIRSERRELMETIDAASMSHVKSLNPNYPQTKLDRLIKHFAFKEVNRCGYDGTWPRMDFVFKQSAYDTINEYLCAQVPETAEVEENLKQAEALLKSQASSEQDGALAAALKQFLMLRLTLDRDHCNEHGTEILFRNDLATRGRTRDWNKHMRRIDQIVYQVARDHVKLCGQDVDQNLVSALKQLDRDTYRRVLGLASSTYLESQDYDDIVASLNDKEVDGDFTIPMMVDYARKLVESATTTSFVQLREIKKAFPFMVRQYVRALYLGDPNGEYRAEAEASKKGNMGVFIPDKARPTELLNKYLINPCQNYLLKFESIMESDKYMSQLTSQNYQSPKEKFVDGLSQHMIRAGYQACKAVIDDKSAILSSFQYYLKICGDNKKYYADLDGHYSRLEPQYY